MWNPPTSFAALLLLVAEEELRSCPDDLSSVTVDDNFLVSPQEGEYRDRGTIQVPLHQASARFCEVLLVVFNFLVLGFLGF